MMPWAKLSTAPVTSSQPPKMRKAARIRSVRGARRVNHRAASRPMSAPGISHEIWPPIWRQEEPVPAGRTPHAAGRPVTADAAGLVAGEAAEAVVAEDEVELRVVGRTAHVGTVGGRRQLDGGHPPSGRHDQGDGGVDELDDATTELGRTGQQVDEGQHGQEDEGLEHLGDEAEPDEGAGQDDPAGAAALDGPHGGVGRRRQRPE